MRIWQSAGAALLLLSLLLSGCSPRETQSDHLDLSAGSKKSPPKVNGQMIIQPLHVISVDSIAVKSKHALFKVLVETPDPCWKFSHFDVENRDGKKFITIFGQRNPAEICIQMIGTLEAEVRLDVSEAGEYHCQFWCGESQTVNQSVKIPK